MKTILAGCVLFLCFACAQAQVSQPPGVPAPGLTLLPIPDPTLQKAMIDEYPKGTAYIRGNWAYAIPTTGPDPVRIGDIQYRIGRKLYASLDDHMNSKGEKNGETSTGWFSVQQLPGERASGIIETAYKMPIVKGKVNRITVEMRLFGSYKREGESVPLVWTPQPAEGVFHGEGVK